MSGMLERVARAIWAIRREDEDRCDMELEDLRPTHSVWSEARAAIGAMREPTEWMMAGALTSGGTKRWDYDVLNAVADDYRAMIDAALAEPQS